MFKFKLKKKLQGCLGQSGRKGWEMTLFWTMIFSHQGTLFLQGYFNHFMLVIKDIYSSFCCPNSHLVIKALSQVALWLEGKRHRSSSVEAEARDKIMVQGIY